MISDLSALYFEIPATDTLGRMQVTGKLLAAGHSLQLFWKLKDRTFKQASEEMQTVEIAYTNVESLRLKSTLGLWKHRLILHLHDPMPLQSVPGTDVGSATLVLTGSGVKVAARKFIRMVDYRQTEAEAQRRIDRLSDMETPGSL